MGVNGHLLHQWIFSGKQKQDEEIITGMFSHCGAVILGSRTYLTAIDGVWEKTSPFPAPAIVLSSKKFSLKEGFSLVHEGIEAALSQARTMAKEKDILVMGGANVVQQYLAANLIDELQLHVAPILLRRGTRLFDDEQAGVIRFHKIKLVESPAATHIFLKPASE